MSADLCDGQKANFMCGNDSALVIREAIYGAMHVACGLQDNDLAVGCTTDVTYLVGGICNGRSTCSFHVSNRVFGDVCHRTSEFLVVKFTCLSAVTGNRSYC